MSRWTIFGLAALVVGLLGGTFSLPSSSGTAPVRIGEELVLEADFHVHTYLGDGLLSPIGVVLHAERRGLDAIAITNHNQVLAAKAARAFSRMIDGPLVLVGQEITSPTWHLIGAGIESRVDWRPPLADVIAAVHEQGGVAIAAHPTARCRDAYGDLSKLNLDGTEVVHAMVLAEDGGEAAQELREFYRAAQPHGVAAIGSTDHHFFDFLGAVRTYVFVEAATEEGVLEAIREGRTVVVDPEGRTFGDAARAEALVPLLELERRRRSPARVAFGLVGLAGICIVFLTQRPR